MNNIKPFSVSRPAATTLRVLSLNDMVDASGGVSNIVDLIQKSGADVVGLQESTDNTRAIADALGFNQVQQHDDVAVLSRFPITGTTPGKQGVTVQLDNGQEVTVFNVHPYYKPYQPYQLLGIPYEGEPFLSTEPQAIDAAVAARGQDVVAALNDMATVASDKPAVLTGDFNEPSYLDWTDATARAGRHPIKVAWPTTHAFAGAGFIDSYRTLYPDEMQHPGFTWTPTTSPDDPLDHHDRIDYVMYRGSGIQAKAVDIVGEDADNATIVVTPYPSDHRAVLATFEVAPPPATAST